MSTTRMHAGPPRERGVPRTTLHVFEPAAAGVPAFVRAIATVQAGRGDEVHVLAPADWERGPHAAAVAWQMWSWDPQRWGLRDVWAASRRYRQVVASVRPDIVHLHSFYAGLVGRLRRPPAGATVYQPHAWSFTRAGAGGGLARALERGLGRRTDVLVTVSEAEAQEGRASGVTTPAVTCSVPVDLHRFAPPSPHVRARDRGRLGLYPETRVVVSVGRLSRQKGQDLLVQQWLRHRHALDDAGAHLFLVGPGDTRQVAGWAGDALGQRVHHVGGVADVRPWLAVADVVVQPSRWEGMSIAVAESLACGVPVVATDVAGMREMIGDGGDAAGAVVPLHASSLVPEVLERLRSQDLRGQESLAARARATKLFDPEQVTDRVEIAYEMALGRRSA